LLYSDKKYRKCICIIWWKWKSRE